MASFLTRWKNSFAKRKFKIKQHLEESHLDTSKNSNHILQAHGEELPQGKRFCIYCIWQNAEIPWYVRNALEALAAQQVNVIVVTNARLSQAALDILRPYCWRIIERANVGRDMGAYKDATLYLRSHSTAIESILYLNDSIYLFSRTTSDLFQKIYTSTSDICAPFESWDKTYHIQSYCLRLNQRIIDTPLFWEFWEDYRPVNTREWSILNGEIGLSNCIKKCSPSIEIIYSTHRLHQQLSALSPSCIQSAMSLIPRRQRTPIQDKHHTELINHYLQVMTGVSEVHYGALLHIEYNQCPILKRDIIFTGVFLPFEVASVLYQKFDSHEVDQALDEIRCKGMLTHLPQIERYKLRR
ncbi:MAG: rhamnan synthesis F family protein [Comamonas sp.]